MARSVDRINWMMVGVCSPSIGDERGIFTCSIPTSNEWDIQVQRLPNSKPNGTKVRYKHLVPHWPWDGSLWCINRENWEQRACPLGTWSFRARKGGNYARTCVCSRRRCRVWVRVWVCCPLRSAPAHPPTGVCERIRTARQRLSENRPCGWAVGPNGCDGSVRTVATVGKMADENALPERYK